MNALDWLASSLLPGVRAELARRADFEEYERMVQLSGFVDIGEAGREDVQSTPEEDDN